MCRNQDSRQDLYAIDRLFFLAGVEGHSRFASCLLDDPNALHFGTRLRTFLLKNSTPYCFSLRKNPQERFWRQCHIKRTVTKFHTVEPFVALGLLNLMPFDALLMLLKILCKFDAQLPKNRHS